MVEESQVVTRYAYVLFYRRRNSPVERPAHFHRPGGAECPTAAGAAASQVRAHSFPVSQAFLWERLAAETHHSLLTVPSALYVQICVFRRSRFSAFNSPSCWVDCSFLCIPVQHRVVVF